MSKRKNEDENHASRLDQHEDSSDESSLPTTFPVTTASRIIAKAKRQESNACAPPSFTGFMGLKLSTAQLNTESLATHNGMMVPAVAPAHAHESIQKIFNDSPPGNAWICLYQDEMTSLNRDFLSWAQKWTSTATFMDLSAGWEIYMAERQKITEKYMTRFTQTSSATDGANNGTQITVDSTIAKPTVSYKPPVLAETTSIFGVKPAQNVQIGKAPEVSFGVELPPSAEKSTMKPFGVTFGDEAEASAKPVEFSFGEIPTESPSIPNSSPFPFGVKKQAAETSSPLAKSVFGLQPAQVPLASSFFSAPSNAEKVTTSNPAEVTFGVKNAEKIPSPAGVSKPADFPFGAKPATETTFKSAFGVMTNNSAPVPNPFFSAPSNTEKMTTFNATEITFGDKPAEKNPSPPKPAEFPFGVKPTTETMFKPAFGAMPTDSSPAPTSFFSSFKPAESTGSAFSFGGPPAVTSTAGPPALFSFGKPAAAQQQPQTFSFSSTSSAPSQVTKPPGFQGLGTSNKFAALAEERAGEGGSDGGEEDQAEEVQIEKKVVDEEDEENLFSSMAKVFELVKGNDGAGSYQLLATGILRINKYIQGVNTGKYRIFVRPDSSAGRVQFNSMFSCAFKPDQKSKNSFTINVPHSEGVIKTILVRVKGPAELAQCLAVLDVGLKTLS